VGRPRILVLTPDFPPARGGIQVLIHRVVSGWERVVPTVVTLKADGCHAFDSALPYRVRRVTRAHGLPRQLEIGTLNAAAVAAGLRTAPDLVVSGHVVTAPAAMALRRLRGIPFLQYLYAQEIDTRPSLTELAVTRAARVVAISRYTADLASACGASEGSTRVILPGVDLPTGVRAPRSDRPIILTVARLRDAYKGHDTMLEAMPAICERVPGVRWVILGDGPLRSSLEADVARRSLGDAVQFLGSVSDEERDAWLDRAWVFAMPSRVPPGSMSGEGFGIVYLEAGAHGLPVVAGRAGGAVDAVIDGETGTLVDPTDASAVAHAITTLLEDPVRARQMGAAGEARAQELAWPLVSRRVEDEILALVARGQPLRGTRSSSAPLA